MTVLDHIGSAWVVLNVVDPSVDVLIYNPTDGFQVLPSRIYNQAAELRGQVEIRTASGQGTTVTLSAPIP